jgi:divalent metal cation (Fe/Co/Zn/Cd) transporter
MSIRAMNEPGKKGQEAEPDRRVLVRRGFHLSLFTVLWNVCEGVLAVAAGMMAGSVALLGFGMDSFIETISGVVVSWRFAVEMGERSRSRAEKAELRASRLAGVLLLALAAYLVFDAARRLFGAGKEPAPSFLGIGLTIVSLIVMPVLAKAKLRVAGGLQSRALRADAYETITCSWLSATTLGGLILNAFLGWWWADPVAALALLPLIVREGLEGLRGETECSCHDDAEALLK